VKAGLRGTRVKAEEYDAEVPRCETRLEGGVAATWAKDQLGRTVCRKKQPKINKVIRRLDFDIGNY